MKRWQFCGLMVAIYAAPHTPREAAGIPFGVFAVLTVLFIAVGK